MKVIVGLGNPGKKYQSNRHNIGFVVVDALQKMISPGQDVEQFGEWSESKKFLGDVALGDKIILLKPSTFMNDSGKAISAIKRFYKIDNEDLYVVHDDLDIAIGNYKIQFGKGPQIHNGLLSIEQELGTDQFWNVRVGVENRVVRGNKGVPGVVYSLQDFSPEEKVSMDGVIAKIVAELQVVVS